uniref:Beta V4 protein n=1 Tax=Cotton leaf curl Multan betasatellite TaxID=306025 RepID=Q8QNS2_9VIRU|nr:beta V4 protein [Cotton leaf curl Multan betasatellite]
MRKGKTELKRKNKEKKQGYIIYERNGSAANRNRKTQGKRKNKK